MTRKLLLFLLASLPQTCLAAVIFDWAYVGNAGNAPDPQTGYGAVSYNYAIAKHEVTNAQYAAFLNSVDPARTRPIAIYEFLMGVESFGGIHIEVNNPIGSQYVVLAGREQKPAAFISIRSAMRFVNWMHNGQGSGDTETGVYTIGSGTDEVRSPNAKYWIPNEDEWYKAAYHDKSAGTAGVYFDYANSSNTAPISDRPSDNPAAANYFNDDGLANGFNDGYATTGSTFLPRSVSAFTDVGAYTAAVSPYGTFDQDGNVGENNESLFSPLWRGLRGGSSHAELAILGALHRDWTNPNGASSDQGFRIAMAVPEPTTLALASMLAGCGMMGRRIA